MIWAKWCGYSKEAIEHWRKLEADHNNTNINGYVVNLNDYEESEHKDLIGPDKKYNVDGFPTIILVKNDGQDQIKFNAIEYNDMLEKIKSNLQ
jgi:thiol-disulfide isomerase/thioredoxin